MGQSQPQESTTKKMAYWSKKRKDAAAGLAILSILLTLLYALTARFTGLVGVVIFLLLLLLFCASVFFNTSYYTEQEKVLFQPQDAGPLSLSEQEQMSQQSEQILQEKIQEQPALSPSPGFFLEPEQARETVPLAASASTVRDELEGVSSMPPLTMKCPECKGTGRLYSTCLHCEGGYPAWNNYPLVVRAQYLSPCTICGGSGHIDPHPCSHCSGTGEVIRHAYTPGDNIPVPRILFALSVVLLAISLSVGLSNTPADGTPLVIANPTLAHTVGVIGLVGLLFLLIVWIWCLYLTYERNQPGWRRALWFTVFSAAIPVILYLLLNPQYEQERD